MKKLYLFIFIIGILLMFFAACYAAFEHNTILGIGVLGGELFISGYVLLSNDI